MYIYFRTNFSKKIGLGHFSRCMRLYNYFEKKGHYCQMILDKPSNIDNFFLSAPKIKIKYLYENFNFRDQILDANYFLKTTRKQGIVFVDDYRFDNKWEEKIFKFHKKVIVIEDLNNKKHYSNFIVNSNPKYNYPQLYTNLNLYSKSKLLLGTNFSLLKPKKEEEIKNQNITFYFGGSGKLNHFIHIIKRLKKKIKNKIFIISGPLSNNKKILSEIENKKKIKVFYNVNNLDKILCKTSLLISSSGMISLEASRYKIPSILFQVVNNQLVDSKYLEKIGLLFNLKKKHLNDKKGIINLIINILNNFKKIKYLVNNSKTVDGKGIERIYDNIFCKRKEKIKKKIDKKNNLYKKRQLIKINDEAMNSYYSARNLFVNRKNSNSQNKIDLLSHYNWWLENKKEIKVLRKNNVDLLFIKNEFFKYKKIDICINGWIKNDSTLNGLDVIWSLKKNILNIKQDNKKIIIFGVAKKNNKFANYHTKYLGYKIYDFHNSKINSFLKKKIKNLKNINIYIM